MRYKLEFVFSKQSKKICMERGVTGQALVLLVIYWFETVVCFADDPSLTKSQISLLYSLTFQCKTSAGLVRTKSAIHTQSNMSCRPIKLFIVVMIIPNSSYRGQDTQRKFFCRLFFFICKRWDLALLTRRFSVLKLVISLSGRIKLFPILSYVSSVMLPKMFTANLEM